jgi:hypothetical protein
MFAGAVASVIIPGFLYIQNHGKMKVLVPALQGQVEECIDTNVAFVGEIGDLNIRIRGMNTQRRQEIANSKALINEVLTKANQLYDANVALKMDLAVLRFDTLEIIKNDEDFADWANGVMPSVGWSLLRDAAEGSNTSD